MVITARFGHHPEPSIDFCVEVECLEGMAYNSRIGLDDACVVAGRITRAMTFTVGGDPIAVSAKQRLRGIEIRLLAGSANQPLDRTTS